MKLPTIGRCAAVIQPLFFSLVASPPPAAADQYFRGSIPYPPIDGCASFTTRTSCLAGAGECTWHPLMNGCVSATATATAQTNLKENEEETNGDGETKLKASRDLQKATSKPTTMTPTAPTQSPTTRSPTTQKPTTSKPTTRSPTSKPSTRTPTSKPTINPTSQPTTSTPTTLTPSAKPTEKPSATPSSIPTSKPTTLTPTSFPSAKPTATPSATPSSTVTVTYPPEVPISAVLLNPERGFYTHTEYNTLGPTPLAASTLASTLSSGRSIILRIVYLTAFIDGSNISQSVLADMSTDFDTMRTGGVKCVLRFAYTASQTATPTEPPKSAVLNHVAQLTPILTANQDAILALQAGFIGPWGEWHGSTNFNYDANGRKEVLGALLDAVPNRTVQIRTPQHKKTLYTNCDILYSSGHVSNGGFENGTLGWASYMNGFTVSTLPADVLNGTRAVKVTNGAASQVVTLTASAGYVVKISGFSKRVNDVQFTDSTWLYGQNALFTGAASWNFASHTFTVPAGKTVMRISLYTMYRNVNDGYALFDDVAVSVYAPCSGGEAINSGNAFNGSHITRIGHHNDCFLASDTDYGTYTSPANSVEYAYLAQETKFTAMGGETCNPNPPRSLCTTGKEELKLFHYTYINSAYHPAVLGNWTSGGCMNEIAALLGYRLVLKTGTFGSRAAPGGIVPYSIVVENVGYASLVNRRPFQLVLRENLTNATCGGIALEVDTRKWFGNESHAVLGNLVLPMNIPVGNYALFLNLADDSERLRNDIRFKVKVANTGLNEAGTGMIDLQHSLIVAVNASSAPSNVGENIAVACGF
ncbi:hypothetical protein ACHAW5_003808 [Stephanodiscus triporus]|uniref:DUF4832 domain-containing protein n=1 Tax=Stephanodiscus triporus TaxID=2934178 RepID=A0ABD3PXV4_9STRA